MQGKIEFSSLCTSVQRKRKRLLYIAGTPKETRISTRNGVTPDVSRLKEIAISFHYPMSHGWSGL